MKVKVISAGSIGNHLTHAARRMGWEVAVTDVNPEALRRMREEIYPSRYGAWDEGITQYISGEEPKGGWDIICLGVPPDVRMKVALEALKEAPRILQLEKPLCAPTLEGLDQFQRAYAMKQNETIALMGYDHAISPAFTSFLEIVRSGQVGKVLSIDAEFREHWQGIFKAHPWLSGPESTYLGHAKRGGGAGNEHSHALHLFLATARAAWGKGWMSRMSSHFFMREEGLAFYDAQMALTFESRSRNIGRVTQDVITLPVKKRLWVQGNRGYAELLINGHPSGDQVRWERDVSGKPVLSENVFEKKRPDDFYAEMRHFNGILGGTIDAEKSPLSFQSGVEVMELLHDGYRHAGVLD